MRYVVASVVLSAFFASRVLGEDPKRKSEPAKASTLSKLEQLTSDLKEARELLKKVTNKETRDKLELLITRSELAAKDIQHELRTGGVPAAMSDADFEKFLKSVKSNGFDDGKLKFVRSLGKTARLSSAQVKQILSTFAFDKDRIEAAVFLHPLVTDPALFATSLEAFSFSSSRKEVLDKIGGK